MSLQDMKHFIKGVVAMREGRAPEAETELAKSLRVDQLPSYAKENMRQLLDADNPSDAVLTIIQGEKND